MSLPPSHALSSSEQAWVRQNVVRLRMARPRAAITVPSLGERLTELSLAKIALALAVSPRELATNPDQLAARLNRTLLQAADAARLRPAEGTELARSAWAEAQRLAFPAYAGQAADWLARQALSERRPLDAVTWLLRALGTPLGAEAASRRTLVARLGAALMLTEHYDVAQAALASVDPGDVGGAWDDVHAAIAHAASLMLQGNFAQSVAAYRAVLQASGNLAPRVEAQVWVGLGAALGLIGDVAGAQAASAAAGALMDREPMPDLHGTLAANDVWCAAIAAPWEEARRVVQAALPEARLPFARANLYDTLAFVLCRGEDWAAVWEACTAGLSELRQAPDGSHLLKARFLWARAVAARHLGRDGALTDHEWAQDLFNLLGAWGHLSALPRWPDDPPSAGPHGLLDSADDAVHLGPRVVGRQAQPHSASTPLGFEP